jgi:hypothetical protein
MRRALRFWLRVGLLGTFLFSASPLSASISFSLLPSDGNISGAPGALVGWGYSLTNTDPSNWFLSTDLNSDSFANGTPTLLFDFPILAPGETVTEAFDAIDSIGLFELQWDSSVPVGFVNAGNFVLSGQWWDGDPLNGGNFVGDAPDTSLPYSAVASSPVSSVPEPWSFWLLMIGLCLVAGSANAVRKTERRERGGDLPLGRGKRS